MERLTAEERWSPEIVGVCPQHFWYRLAACWARGKRVLDVGAGAGYGIDMIRSVCPLEVVGIDPAPMRPDIHSASIVEIADRDFDLVLAVDVIEHVEHDREFLSHLLRAAREAVFISTPNWNVSHCLNEFHCREYTPEELVDLIGDRRASYWSGTIQGGVEPIKHPKDAEAYFGVRVEC